MTNLPSRRLVALMAASLLLLLIMACGNGGQTAEILFSLQRLAPQVFLGESENALQPLPSSAPRPVSPGAFISTDAQGEGLLLGKLPGNETCRIHIFYDTRLRASACSKTAEAAGSTVTCQEAGTAVYQSCAGNLQQTPSGVIRITGSWVIISYQPELQLTLVTVLEGEAQVAPVLDARDYTLGQAISLKPGYFLFTQPDAHLSPVADLEPRQPHPIADLPRLLDALGLLPVYERIQKQARDDGVLPETPTPAASPTPSPTPPLETAVQAAGGPLEDPFVSRAVVTAIDWRELQAVFGSKEPIPISLPGVEGLAPDDFPFDPPYARQILAESGAEAGFVLLLVTLEDDVHLKAADVLRANLAEIGVKTPVYPATLEQAPDLLAELAAAGQAVMWLGPAIPDDWKQAASPPLQTRILAPEKAESGTLTSFEEIFPGEWAVGDTREDASVQLVLSFDITGIPPDGRITDAALNLEDFTIQGEPFRDLGCLRAYPLTPQPLNVSAFGWEPELGAVARWCSEEALRSRAEQPSLRKALQTSLGEKRFTLRLRFNETPTDDDGQADLLRFTQPGLQIRYEEAGDR